MQGFPCIIFYLRASGLKVPQSVSSTDVAFLGLISIWPAVHRSPDL